MNYSRFGAICEPESVQVFIIDASVRPYRNHCMAPLFTSKESRFGYILTSRKVLQMGA